MSRERPAELPLHVPLQSNAVATAKRQHYAAKRESTAHFAAVIAAIAGFDMFNLLPRLRGSDKPQLLDRSKRSDAAIMAQLRDFYTQRPRPWISPAARARLRRASNHERIVYDKQASREARCRT